MEKLINNKLTDIHIDHSYLNIYETIMSRFKDEDITILGINSILCGTINLCYDYFHKSKIYWFNQGEYIYFENEIYKDPLRLFNIPGNAYDINNYNLIKEHKYDIIIEDGTHKLEDMVKCIDLYLPLLKSGGILIIEDIPDIKYTKILEFCVPDNYKKFIKIYDLRHVKNRFDDILFTINLNVVAESSAKNDSEINNAFDDSAINNAVLQYL
jgi:hypothetical protein